MKAWRIERHGGPEVLHYQEVPDAKPGPMEVRVRVEAVGLNHLDLWTRKGVPGHHFTLPMTPGCDIAGVIDGWGEGSAAVLEQEGLKHGSPVVLNPGVSWGRCEWCLSGFDPVCPRYGILGETQDGGCAEWITAPVSNIIARPSSLSAIEAAALQIAKMMGATVITTVGCDSKVEKARTLGADHVISYRKAPFRTELKKILASYGKKGCEHRVLM